MSKIHEVKPVKSYIGKLSHNADLIEEITKFCEKNGIKLARIEALGAVKKARLGYYNQDDKAYQFFEIDKHLEITNLVGNVSLKDGSPIVHAHITLADEKGNAFGGHLAPGTILFACEICIKAFEGAELVRGFDEVTGLPLWEK